ncbi:MAG: ATP-binding protein, partial [Acidobacteria bacterium]|nr:ATP-binding protein [Acidobacteriota bacterium]
MKRVVVTGSECTGKTTLAGALARHYQVPWVPEFARRFVSEKGAAPAFADVEAIARGQVALEDEVAATASTLLIQDTDLLSTVVYSHHYYGACPAWVEAALQERCADLYLLAGIDVPWVADGDQREVLAQNNTPIADGTGHEHLESSSRTLGGDQPHRQDRYGEEDHGRDEAEEILDHENRDVGSFGRTSERPS